MKNDFDDFERYKLYRDVYEIIHPTISKKNISNYKIVLKDNLLPLRVFYPEKITPETKIIIYFHGSGNLNSNHHIYSKVCKNIVKNTNTMLIAIDYPDFKKNSYSSVVANCYSILKYLYNNLEELGILNSNIILMGDSIGATIVISLSLMVRLKKDFIINKEILLYPIISGNYSLFTKYDMLISKGIYDPQMIKQLEDFLKLIYTNDTSLTNNIVSIDDYSNLPVSLVITGDIDPFKEEGISYYNKLNNNSKLANITFAPHGFISMFDKDIDKDLYKVINDFI